MKKSKNLLQQGASFVEHGARKTSVGQPTSHNQRGKSEPKEMAGKRSTARGRKV